LKTSIEPGVILRSVPEVNTLIAKLQPDGSPNIGLPNMFPLFPIMEKEIRKNAKVLWLPNVKREQLERARWIINLCADADEYENTMQIAEQLLDGIEAPVFNHPRYIPLTRRDVVWKVLEGIEGLITPQCTRFLANHPDDFPKVFREMGFEYPVIIRPYALQTGRYQTLIRSDEDWTKIDKIPWGGTFMYMTQWVDFSNENGDWVKSRIVVTPEDIGVRHTLIGGDWQVHAEQRLGTRVDREIARTQTPSRWQHFRKIGEEARKRIPLDTFGIDVGWKSQSETVLFEANAAMSILSQGHTPEYRRLDFATNIHRSEDQIWNALINKTGQPFRKIPEKLF